MYIHSFHDPAKVANLLITLYTGMDQARDMDAFYEARGLNAYTWYPQHNAIVDLVQGPRVLDVGCGTGDLLSMLSERYPDWSIAGTDISKVALKMAQSRDIIADFKLTSIVPFGSWDTIVMSQVLEHVDDDTMFIKFISDALGSTGRFVVSVPNDGAIPSVYHKHTYTPDSLSNLLSNIGKVDFIDWEGMEKRLIAVVDRG